VSSSSMLIIIQKLAKSGFACSSLSNIANLSEK